MSYNVYVNKKDENLIYDEFEGNVDFYKVIHLFHIIPEWERKSNFQETGIKMNDAYRSDNEINYLCNHLDWTTEVDSHSQRYVDSILKRLSFEPRTENEYQEISSNQLETGVLETNIQRKIREDKNIPSNIDRDKEKAKRAHTILSYEDWLDFIEEFPWKNPLFTYSLK